MFCQKQPTKDTQLGTRGPMISKLGFGCLQLSLKPMPLEDKIQLILNAYKMGVTLFDTAAVYGKDRENEKTLGQALKKIDPKNVTIVTKCGISFQAEAGNYFPQSEEDIRNSVDESLKNLGVDSIDVLLLHRIKPGAKHDDYVEPIAVMKQLVLEGKVKHIGLSEATAEQIEHAVHIGPKEIGIDVVEIAYSLFTRRAERNGVKAMCEKYGIGILAYTSVIRGSIEPSLLDVLSREHVEASDAKSLKTIFFKHTGISPFEQTVGYFDDEYFKENLLCILDFLSIAKEYGIKPSTLALAWVIEQGIIPIPGTTNLKHLRDNVKAMSLDTKIANIISEDMFPVDRFRGIPNPSRLSQFCEVTLENYKRDTESHMSLKIT